jgi:hypothetical protein
MGRRLADAASDVKPAPSQAGRRPPKEAAMSLELSAEERDVLADLLDQSVRDLKSEIADTDLSDYKRRLHVRERVLTGLLQKVQQATTA